MRLDLMRWIALILLLVTSPASALAETRQFGNIVFTMPSGWLGGKVESTTKILLPRSRVADCTGCRIYLGKGSLKHENLETFLLGQIHGLHNGDDRSKIKMKTKPASFQAGSHEALFVTWSFAEREIFLGLAIELSSRYEFTAFRARSDGSDVTKKMNRYFEPFVASLKFVSEGEPALLPEARPGSLAGVYRGYQLGVSVGAGGAGTLSQQYKTLVFWRDGHFYEGTPPNGLAPLDTKELLEAYDSAFGVYREQESQIVLTFSDGRKQSMSPLSDGRWQLDEREMLPVEPVEDNSRFDSRLSAMTFGGFTSGSGIDGGTLAALDIQLFDDGTYSVNSMLSTGGGFSGGGGFAAGGRERAEGTYQVKDGLIRFIAQDGKQLPPKLIYRHRAKIFIGSMELK